MKKLLNEMETGQLLDCSRSKLQQLRKNGLPYVKVGGSVRYDQDELQAWLKARTTGGAQERPQIKE